MGDSFMDLVVWQRTVQPSIETYRLTASFPKPEQFGLRADVSRMLIAMMSKLKN